jgi:glycosyltransferase involved in cell wall biosynthesis
MKNLKITIITTCLNSDKSIPYTLSSIKQQTYKNLEHIIVDGGSTDDTLELIGKHSAKKKIIRAKKLSIYQGINEGIKKSTGDYVLILNSDDILDNKNTIKEIVKIITVKKKKIYLGDVLYFNSTKFNNFIRFYSAKKFKNWMLYFGLMPPHPGAIIESNLAKENLYNPKYKIAADFDFFLRILKMKKEKFETINLVITRMRTGGISGKNIMAHFISGSEIYKSLKSHNQYANHILINLRYFIKMTQFFFKKQKRFLFTITKEYKKLLRFDFKIIKDVKKLNFKKNFVLSALNLAFIGSYIENDVKLYKNLIHWPDGIFVKNISPHIKKVPGREIIKNLELPEYIKQVTVFGNLPSKSYHYLKKKFQKKISNIILPYGDIKKITKNFEYRIKTDEFILITLPTPKQEQLAQCLIKKNKNFRIICIGGSINILSGLEKKVPKYLYYFEFIWRLRYETFRRLKRLFSTFNSYTKGKYFQKKLDNLNIKLID